MSLKDKIFFNKSKHSKILKLLVVRYMMLHTFSCYEQEDDFMDPPITSRMLKKIFPFN